MTFLFCLIPFIPPALLFAAFAVIDRRERKKHHDRWGRL